MKINSLTFAFDLYAAHSFFDTQSASFSPHALNFIVGENGVGKSTLFAAMQGNVSATMRYDMAVTLDDVLYTTNNNNMPTEYLSLVRVVQQRYDRMLADRLSFKDNLRCAQIDTYPRLHALPEATLFDIVNGLGIDIEAPVYTLSGGQRQLLAICMALQKKTKLLLLDEPTATLDPHNAQMVMQCLQQLAESLQITVIIICHDQAIVNRYGSNGTVFEIRKQQNGERIIQRSHCYQ